MAGDKNGTPLVPGGVVTLRCKVLAVNEAQGVVSVTLQPAEDAGGGELTRTFGVNARQVEVVPDAKPAKDAK